MHKKALRSLFCWLSIVMNNLHWTYQTESTTDLHNLRKEEFINFQEHNQISRQLCCVLENINQPTLLINHNRWGMMDEIVDSLTSIIRSSKKFADYKHIIIDSSIDPVDYRSLCLRLIPIAQEAGIDKMVLMGGFNNIKNSNVIVEPSSFWYFRSIFLVKNYKKRVIDIDTPRAREFSCLNRTPKDHRLIFYSSIKERGLLGSFIYSFHDKWAHFPEEPKIIDGMLPPPLIIHPGSDRWKQVRTDVADFPISWPGQPTGPNDHGIDHPAYHDAYCNIVTETEMRSDFISEKIWKPIAAGQLFLVIGSPGTCDYLESLGFYTFEKELYDGETDHLRRLDKVTDIVESKRGHVRQWWLDNLDKIQHNRARFYSDEFQNFMINRIARHCN